jgi:hypothetical protein
VKRPVQNIAHSIHERLLSLAKARNEEFQNFLTRYALERLLYRLTLTPCAGPRHDGHQWIISREQDTTTKAAIKNGNWGKTPIDCV